MEQRDETVLVTGITGFLGSHIAVQLLRQGYRVRGTLRSPARAGGIERTIRAQPGATGALSFHEADLSADRGWAEAVAGCRYVIHAASPFPATQPKDAEELIRPARDGALRVLRAAKQAGVERVVMTSSTIAISWSGGRAPYDEEDWTDLGNPACTPYCQSKTLAEQAAWAFARENALELAVINPGLILGPLLEKDYSLSLEAVRKLLRGELPGTPKLCFPVVDVRDCAAAHLLAMTRPQAAGQRFIAAGASLWLRDIATILRAAYPERKLPRRDLPNWLVRALALFDPVLRSITAELERDNSVTNDKARRLLGWQPRPEQEAVLASAESLIAQGLA